MSFALLALVCAVALVGPLLASTRRVRLPVVIGELGVGILLGATGLRWIDATNPTFAFMGQIGFALVMFIAGSHVPIRNAALRQGLGRAAGRAALVGVMSVPAGFGIAALFDTGHGPLYAVLLASSSASLVLPALEGVPLTSVPALQLLAQLAIADAACIVLLPLAIDPAHAGTAALGALAVLAAGALLFLVLTVLARRGRAERLHQYSERRALAMELRITLLLLFSLAMVASVSKVSVMLAGFVAGLVVSAVGEHRRVQNQIFALSEGFFAPLFFVWLGASLNLRHLVEHPSAIVLGVALGVAALAVHVLVGAVTKQPLSFAALTAAQLGVPVGAVALGTQAALFAPGEGSALLLGALITIAGVSIVAPAAIRRLASATEGSARAS
ncbi:cation:proton antiporter [Leucobacter sp. CSA2]|uniref:Cation:proton antiporter n=1 Tax=Leucobacter edaphi TaxID=2796472 RepID=A0A934QDU9_9MICO|nr:cation:proton antiporter [Leucobacter edaphi]MBK0421996.1 cation:proton antiporter [Leucobacter edaphi]